MRFYFKPVEPSQRALVHQWLKTPHAAEWFYGQGLENTINHLDEFFQGNRQVHYWIGYDNAHPFAFFITTFVTQEDVKLKKWCLEKGPAITLDILIGDANYLGKGLAPQLIREFLLSQFPDVTEVLIDPEASNARAVHVYQKVGFAIIDTFIPSHSPHLHYMMRLSMKQLK